KIIVQETLEEMGTRFVLPHKFVLNQVLRKVEEDCAEGILIAPDWSTQTWYPMLLRLQQRPPLKLHWTTDLLALLQ
ncbi:hypothetical protein ScPMuIL_012217, partial [Solemya velum]